MTNPVSTRELLRWYMEAGVDEAVGEEAVDRYAVTAAAAPAPERPKPAASPRAPASSARATAAAQPQGAVQSACAAATGAATVADLRRALETFDGCGLKATATNLVFHDGNPEARIILVGEAPGAEEDRQGLPFVGKSGQLLDRMLASIGLDRTRVLITNTVFWRPPGNRNPTTAEMATCMPFLERLVDLVDPAILVALGGSAAKTLLARNESVGKLRGHWFHYSTPGLPRPVPATAIYHPAYLLRSPAQKRATWRDLLEIKRKLDSL